MMSTAPVTGFAPAKINLYLHITGKRADGYHLLDSLSVFADCGDTLTFTPADALSVMISGPFAASLSHEPPSTNLVWRAAQALADYAGRAPGVAITLDKQIPPGAGLGGGSADAAATIKGLMTLWDITPPSDALYDLLNALGSDVAACYTAAPLIMRGVGDVIEPAPVLPALPMVLVYPGVPSSTPAAYRSFRGPFSVHASLPARFESDGALIDFLKAQTNDLYAPALEAVPVIKDVLKVLEDQDGNKLSRMSGSGSACFGIFTSPGAARSAASAISRSYPHWWVRPGGLWFPD